MSLILQALKKAEAERALGQVPSVHATLAAEGAATATGGRRVIGRWLGLAAIVAAAAAAAGWWIARDKVSGAIPAAPAASVAMAPPVASVAMAPPAASVPMALPAPAPALSPPVAPEAAMPAAPASAGVVALPAPPSAAVAPLIVLPATPAPAAAPSAVAAAAPPSPRRPPLPAVAAQPARPASTTVPDVPVRRLDELAPELRSALPALAVSGSIYSAQRSERMVILNGEVHREGDRLAPDLVLERIEPKSAVLRFRGQAVRLPF